MQSRDHCIQHQLYDLVSRVATIVNSTLFAPSSSQISQEPYSVQNIERLFTGGPITAAGVSISQAHASETLVPWKGVNIYISPSHDCKLLIDLVWYRQLGVSVPMPLLTLLQQSHPRLSTVFASCTLETDGSLCCSSTYLLTALPGFLLLLHRFLPCSGAYRLRYLHGDRASGVDLADMRTVLGPLGRTWHSSSTGIVNGCTELVAPASLETAVLKHRHIDMWTLHSADCQRWLLAGTRCVPCITAQLVIRHRRETLDNSVNSRKDIKVFIDDRCVSLSPRVAKLDGDGVLVLLKTRDNLLSKVRPATLSQSGYC